MFLISKNVTQHRTCLLGSVYFVASELTSVCLCDETALALGVPLFSLVRTLLSPGGHLRVYQLVQPGPPPWRFLNCSSPLTFSCEVLNFTLRSMLKSAPPSVKKHPNRPLSVFTNWLVSQASIPSVRKVFLLYLTFVYQTPCVFGPT